MSPIGDFVDFLWSLHENFEDVEVFVEFGWWHRLCTVFLFQGVEINHLGILNNNRKNIFSKLLGSGNCMLRATSCVKDCGWTARAFAVSWAFWAF